MRDRLEGVPVTNIYDGLSWFSILLCLLLMTAGLWYAPLSLAEKGFYIMAYVLSLFAAITVQKNVRDSVTASSLRDSSNAEFFSVSRL